ncbi:glutamate [NMDA] receptor subunit 1-like [Homarus americanus]|uniref:glutamate [NMDA] receptor subunit 1-like n=1 Tax=Homarus americanus TaxID=6706 RepID=UPI001C46EDEB|nr:glutamate [NMDA] receptor subunit 1-like [Homarus americanus]
MGLFNRREVDISGVFISMDSLRHTVVEPTVPLYTDSQILLYVKPSSQADISGFIKPFTSLSWVAILVSLVVVFVAMLLTQVLEGHYRAPNTHTNNKLKSRDEMADERKSSEDLVWTSWLWSLATFLAQSSPWLPRGPGLRTVAGMWLLISLVVSTVYKSNLKAMMILPKMRLPFTNLEELLETDILCHIAGSTLMHHTIMEAKPGSLFFRLQKQMLVHNDIPKLVADGLAGKYAALNSKYGMMSVLHDVFRQTRSCKVFIGTDRYLADMPFSFVVPRGSPIKAKADTILSRLKESGIITYLLNEKIRYGIECLKRNTEPANSGSSLRPLELRDFYGVFAVYGGGIVLAILVFCMEMRIAIYRPRY